MSFEIPESLVERLRRGLADAVLVAHVLNGRLDPDYPASLSAKTIDGVLRGLIRPGSEVRKGLKIGDVDPRGIAGYCDTISEKARSLGGAVLEAILAEFNV